jgi:streptomycin 6-kinase
MTITDRLNHYLETWMLSNPRLLAETPSSHVYTVISGDETAVLKLLTPVGDEEKHGAVALRCYGGHGAVRLLRADDQAHLLEYVEGDDLIPLVKSGGDEQATAIIAAVLNQLHTAHFDSPPDGLIPLTTWFRVLFEKAKQDERAGIHSIFTKAAPLADELLSNPLDRCVLHGDMHHQNVRYSARRGWLAFDPKGLWGERTFDAANTLCNPVDMPAVVENESRLLKNADILARELGIDLHRILRFTFAYVCLSASWILADGDDAPHEFAIAEILEPHVS